MSCNYCGNYDENCTCGPSGSGSPSWTGKRCESCLNYVLECVCECPDCGLSINLYSGRKLCEGCGVFDAETGEL